MKIVVSIGLLQNWTLLLCKLWNGLTFCFGLFGFYFFNFSIDTSHELSPGEGQTEDTALHLSWNQEHFAKQLDQGINSPLHEHMGLNEV